MTLPFAKACRTIGTWLADRTAARWVARLSDDDSPEVRRAFERWVAENPLHADAFLRVRDGAADGVASIRAKTPSHAGEPTERRNRPAIAMFAMTAGALIITGVVREYWAAKAPSFERTFQADRAGQLITLPDGSALTMGIGASLAVDFDGTTRRVLLGRGSVRFAIAHDAAHPFMVLAGGHEVIARGTIFDVSLRSEGITVSMVEGRVEIQRLGQPQQPTSPVEVERGQRFIARGNDERVEPIPVPSDAGSTSSRRPTPVSDGDQGTALAVLVDRVNRTAKRPIRLDGDIGGMRLRGMIDPGDSETFARQAALALGLKLSPEGNTLVLRAP